MKGREEVRIISGDKVLKVLRGKKARAAIKAVQLVLKKTNTSKIKIDIIDTGIPENFSYSQVLLEAIEKKHLENPIEIAEYILKKLKKTNKKAP